MSDGQVRSHAATSANGHLATPQLIIIANVSCALHHAFAIHERAMHDRKVRRKASDEARPCTHTRDVAVAWSNISCSGCTCGSPHASCSGREANFGDVIDIVTQDCIADCAAARACTGVTRLQVVGLN